MNRRRFLNIAAIGAATTLLGGHRAFAEAGEGSGPVVWRGIALGAEASIKIQGMSRSRAEALLVECRRELVRLESIFSLYDGRSMLSQLNRDGSLANPSVELVEVLRHGALLGAVSGGAFDVSVQPLCELLSASGDREPDAAELVAARALVDYREIEVSEARITLGRAGMRVTLNGLAQGYITDRVAAVLRAGGCEHTLVDLGEKRALGPHIEQRPWRLGIESPAERGTLAGVLDLTDGALATSGGYGTPYGGGRHHLLDARNGANRADGFASVSVLAPTALEADGLSTTLAVVAPTEATALLARFPGCAAYVVRAATPDRLERLA